MPSVMHLDDLERAFVTKNAFCQEEDQLLCWFATAAYSAYPTEALQIYLHFIATGTTGIIEYL